MPNEAFRISYILAWIIIVLLSLAVLFLGRQIGIIYQRLGPGGAMMANPGPKLNAAVARTEVGTIDGTVVAVGGPKKRKSLIVFVSPGCSSCADLASGVRSISRDKSEKLDVVLISSGADSIQHEEFRKRHRLQHLPYIISADVRMQMNITTVPYALLLDEGGVLRSKGIVNSYSHIESLLNVIDSGYNSVQERTDTAHELSASV